MISTNKMFYKHNLFGFVFLSTQEKSHEFCCQNVSKQHVKLTFSLRSAEKKDLFLFYFSSKRRKSYGERGSDMKYNKANTYYK
jgi:hypothetical protein